MKAFAELLVSIIGGIFRLLMQGLINLISKNHQYKAHFGRTRRILKTSHKRNGIAIGKHFISESKALEGGLLLIGKTGSGKSSKIYKQQLHRASKTNMSYIALDVNGDLRNDTGRHMVEVQKYEEEILNFSDADASTITWNPLADLKLDQVNRFANDLVAINMGTDTKDPIWNLMTATVLGVIIRLQILIGKPEYINLYNTRHLVKLLQAEPHKMDALVVLYSKNTSLYLDYKGLVSGNEDKFMQSVLFNTLSCLQQWEDINVIKTTSSSFNELDMESYRYERKILWLQNDVMSQQYLSGLNSLFFTTWFSKITQMGIPSKDSKTLGFLIDEASSLRMKKEILPLVVSQVRKFSAFCLFGYQSFSQVQDLLGQKGAETLKQNTSILYLGNQTLTTGQEISRALGRYSYQEDGVTKSRELLTVEEAMYLEDCKDGGLLFTGQERPLKLKRIQPFYKNKTFRKWAEKPELPIKSVSLEMPPLLPVDQLIASLTDEL